MKKLLKKIKFFYYLNDVSKLIKKEMEQANLPLFPLNIPIIVDFGKADNWSETH